MDNVNQHGILIPKYKEGEVVALRNSTSFGTVRKITTSSRGEYVYYINWNINPNFDYLPVHDKYLTRHISTIRNEKLSILGI